MAVLRTIINVFRSRRVEDDIKRELSFHLAERIDDLESQGMSRRDATRRARRLFGSYALQEERTRDMDVAGWLDELLRNIRLSVRMLRKAPAFTVTVVVILGLGIGASSAIFSAVDAVLLKPLPFPDSDQLMLLSQSNNKDDNTSVASTRLEDWNRLNSTFQAISGYYSEDESETSGELPERLKRVFTPPRFLQVLGVGPAVGRDFAPDEERFGGPPAVLISDRLWRQRFGANPEVIGKSLRIGSRSVPIIGVMPAGFLFPDRDVDLWSPSPVDAPYAQDRRSTWYTVIGRLKPGVSVGEARADLSAVQADLGRTYPKTDADLSVRIQPLKDSAVGAVKESLWILFGSVSLLLLIACTNIAALMLARGAQRKHETAVRISLGASTRAVVAQLMTETFVLALAGAAVGLFLAAGAARVFRLLAGQFPRVEEIKLDWRLVVYTLACTVLVTLICGLAPAIRTARRGISNSLNQAGRSQVFRRQNLQWLLAGVQVALAVALLTGAGLIVRSFQALGRVQPGFEVNHVLTFRINSTWGETKGDMKALKQKTDRILDGLDSTPGVDSAAISVDVPGVTAKFQTEVKLAEGRAESEPKLQAEVRGVSRAYFETMKIPLLAGEVCPDSLKGGSVCVNRSFVNTYDMGAGAIGRHLMTSLDPSGQPLTISAIVGDAREEGMNHEPVPTVYFCLDVAQPGSVFLVRTAAEPMTMAETIRRKMKELEPQRSVFEVQPLAKHLDLAFGEDRLRGILLTGFALTALALAAVGLYGMLSYMVSRRRREVGLRLALGAVRKQILASFLIDGLGVALVGCAIGTGLAISFSRVLAGLLYGVSPNDPATLIGVVVIMLVVACTASLIPAIRAARVEPMDVLREE